MRTRWSAALTVALVVWGCSSQAPIPTAMQSASATPAPAEATPPPSGLSADLGAALAALALPAPSGQTIVAANVQSSGDWTAITAGPSTQDAVRPVAPLTLVLAHRENGTWQVVSERDGPAFCAALAAAPAGLVSPDMRAYFIGCQ